MMLPADMNPGDFGGVIRLFPLPDLVLFPHVVQPLQIFEPRYLQLLEDALQDNQLISMALLRPGWESDYDGHPRIHSTVCLGRVISHCQKADGRYKILLGGVARATVIRELDSDRMYRMAKAVLVQDEPNDQKSGKLLELKQQLIGCFQKESTGSVLHETFQKMLGEEELSLGMLTDVVAFSLRLSPGQKQRLLEELNVENRARVLISLLSRQSARTGSDSFSQRGFPPHFSQN